MPYHRRTGAKADADISFQEAAHTWISLLTSRHSLPRITSRVLTTSFLDSPASMYGVHYPSLLTIGRSQFVKAEAFYPTPAYSMALIS
jgi:hypothetical protein